MFSATPFGFYPEYEDFLIWPGSGNDFILAHNYHAKNKLPAKIFPLQMEFLYDEINREITNILS